MREVFDPRLDIFLNHFLSRKFSIRKAPKTLCPYIPLPQSWDQYLQNCLGSSPRRKLKRQTRRIESDTKFVLNRVDDNSLDEDIEALLQLWQSRWGAKPDNILDMRRAIFTRCYESNSLYLSTLRCEGTPVAAIAGFIDREKNAFYSFMGGWNNSYGKLSPGKVMIGYSIRYAIENGLLKFDFGRGDSDYKFSLGSRECFNTNVIITKRNCKMVLRKRSNQIKRKIQSLNCLSLERSRMHQ
jgi:CelD/BcsL family acetyltransferase involved in cellulose biosynthesis